MTHLLHNPRRIKIWWSPLFPGPGLTLVHGVRFTWSVRILDTSKNFLIMHCPVQRLVFIENFWTSWNSFQAFRSRGTVLVSREPTSASSPTTRFSTAQILTAARHRTRSPGRRSATSQPCSCRCLANCSSKGRRDLMYASLFGLSVPWGGSGLCQILARSNCRDSSQELYIQKVKKWTLSSSISNNYRLQQM